MKSSNLALRLEAAQIPPCEEQPAPGDTGAAALPGALAVGGRSRRPRPRSSFTFRSIVIRDHAPRLFRIF